MGLGQDLNWEVPLFLTRAQSPEPAAWLRDRSLAYQKLIGNRRRRQREVEHGACVRLALSPDPTAVLIHDPCDRCKTDGGAFEIRRCRPDAGTA